MAAKWRWNASAGLSGLLLALAILFALPAFARGAPVLSLEHPTAGSTTNSTPTFSGETSDLVDPVMVLIYEGAPGGAPALTLEASPSPEGGWAVQVPLAKSLAGGNYSAVAEQTELGEPGTTEPVGFDVDTEPPEVALNQPATPSNKTSPTFSGNASEGGEVVVHVFQGAEEVASATASVPSGGGSWTSGALSNALAAGKHAFSAYATEQSSLDNGQGRSATLGFEVNTEKPSVTLKQPATPSNVISPTFSGTASEGGEVVVHVFQGAEEVASATASAPSSGGSWSAGALSKPLPEGKHSFTAYATEQSSLGNGEGQSTTLGFEVDTEPPEVTLQSPASVSSSRTPSFSGTAGEGGKIVVHVFQGEEEVASATANAPAGGGSWSSGPAGPQLPKGRHPYTAYATEQSSLGNRKGTSQTVHFEVSTEPPVVTLNQPTTPSNKTSPTFSGTAGEGGEVVVHVLQGSKQVASATASVASGGGDWTSGALSKSLLEGKHSFTAYATEQSALGNGQGESTTVGFEVNTEPPGVTLNQPATPSNKTSPTFSGTAGEGGEVVVHVFQATKEVASATASIAPGGGSWTSGALSKSLPEGKHSFTAYATEQSALGNGQGESTTVGFEVDTEPPGVTLNQPATPSNKRTPSFSGTASEGGEVVVHVFEEGRPIATATASVSGGDWTSGALSKSLPEGKHGFTAYATEQSALGNRQGESTTVGFEVNTEPPHVTLEQPTTPSNKRTPTFSGTASEAGEVVVRVFQGTTEVAKATAGVASGGGTWASGALSKSLPEGKHSFTAYATEQSALGNDQGESATLGFEVNTEAPVVTLKALAKPLSNVRSPVFSGTASEAGEVVVHVREGTEEVATATASVPAGGGSWSSGALSKSLPEGKNRFTAEATEVSGLGNAEGKSTPLISFEVDTQPPMVTINSPALVSNNRTPSFSGTAIESEPKPVSVNVYSGATASGTPVETLHATVNGSNWTSGHVEPLKDGKYTAVAGEPSSLGNAEGKSSTVTFEVRTNAPTVTLNEPKTPSSITKPSFTGTDSEAGPVTVFVYSGTSSDGPSVTQINAAVKGGSWASGQVELEKGKHVYTAVATSASAIGNETGESAPRTFVVDTEPPELALNQPKALSNDTTPAFSGTTSEKSLVTVSIYKGSADPGNLVATVKDKETTGSWESAAVAKPLEDGQYTAVASQPSEIGNEGATSLPRSFTIDTQTPVVSLGALPTPSPNKSPSFSGTASESGPVIVKVFRGSKASGQVLVETEAEGTGGAWVTGRLETPLEYGEYTALATQDSSIGNPRGESAPSTFVVAQISPTAVTEASSDVTRTSAALYASVDPHAGSVSHCFFEYGPTTAYGTAVECGYVAELPAFPAAATSAVAVFARIYGLHPSTTYHVRIVAEGEGGTGRGADTTFTTLEALTFPGVAAAAAAAPPVAAKAPSGGVAGLFAEELLPRGRGARIGALLKNGFFKQRISSGEAGTATIRWLYTPPSTKKAAKSAHPEPVLIASGRASFAAAGSATMKIRLTKSGRRLLEHSRRIRLRASCTFVPASGKPLTLSASFLLRR